MELILQENVPGLGFVGDVVKVKPGFARNYLLPQKLALPANQGSIKRLEHQKKAIEIKKAGKRSEAQELKTRLETITLTLEHAASENGKLFGSVTATELCDLFTQKGFVIDRKLLKIEKPIKVVGEHKIQIKLHQDVSAEISVQIKAKSTSHDEKEMAEKELQS